jgi:hypothetical protein
MDFTAKNCSNSAIDYHHVVHVVVDSNIPDSIQYQESKQQQHEHDQHGAAKNCSDTIEIGPTPAAITAERMAV